MVGLLAVVLGAPVQAGEVDGFAELRAQYSAGVDGTPVFFIERFRPTFDADLGERLALSVTVEASLTQGRRTQTELQRTLEESDLGPLLDQAECTWPTEDNELLGISEAHDYVWVDRLYFDAYLPFADVRVGRQALNWGSAFMVNPTDPFPQVLLLEPWKPRAGVNAVRASIPIADAHRIQLVAGADDDFKAPRLATRGTVNALQTDWSVIGAWRPEADDGLVGVDIKGTLGVGFWTEAAWHLRQTNPYGEGAVGIDYSFPVLDSLIVTAQYYRNGRDLDSTGTASITSAVEAPDCAAGDTSALFGDGTAEPDPFAPFFTGRQYAMASVGLGLSPLVSASGLFVQNLDDGTGLVFPTIAYSPRGWLEVSAAAQVPVRTWGDGGELSPKDSDLILRQETLPGQDPLVVDFTGLVPDATFIVWTRASF
jgi:hypothetical protein